MKASWVLKKDKEKENPNNEEKKAKLDFLWLLC